MKQINNISFAVILAFILAGLYSCIDDDYCDCDNIGTPESLTMSYSLSSSQKLRTTRALPTEPGNHDGSFNENIVKTLDLFFCQAGKLKLHVPDNELYIEDTSPADSIKKKITIPVTGPIKTLIDAANPVYDVYVVANNTADLSTISVGSNLAALQNLLFTTADFESKGGDQSQTSFVMDGKLTGVNIKTSTDMGKADLKRAASKVRIRILEINDTSDEEYLHDPAMGAPQARLVHFTDQSVLLEGGTAATPAAPAQWKSTPWRDVNTPVDGVVDLPGNTTAAPFYAYSNDWNTDATRETYVELKIPFLKDDVIRDYFYRVPITPYTSTPSDNEIEPSLRKMERDYLYDIAVTINHVGAANNPPVTLDGNYTITDWSEQNIVAEVFMFHYLMVTPVNTVMPNINMVTLDFLSSVSPVQYKDLVVSYTYVLHDTGQPVTSQITSGDQYATINIDNDTKKITVTSAVPVNYIPKDIFFTVYSEPSPSLTVEQQVVIKQLPATYFTTEKGEKSKTHPDGTWFSFDPPQRNRYMYMITTLVPTGDVIWGFPPLDNNNNTQNNATVANMASPSFMMASQLGASTIMDYDEAVDRCNEYWEETIINGVTVRYDDWRLPTEAELKIIDDLQHDSNNPQGVVLSGNYYWSAYATWLDEPISGWFSWDGAYLMKAPLESTSYSYYAPARCVRDVK